MVSGSVLRRSFRNELFCESRSRARRIWRPRYLACIFTMARATITLNRPARMNAIDHRLPTALREAVENCQRDDAVKVVVLRGAGRGFCGGYDLEQYAERKVSSRPGPWRSGVEGGDNLVSRWSERNEEKSKKKRNKENEN